MGIRTVGLDYKLDGSGTGYGPGYGTGYGPGYGTGFGDGVGDGSGDGAGDGSGYGYGDGYGEGDGNYWSTCVAQSLQQNQSAHARAVTLTKQGAMIALWRSDKYGLPANGGYSKEPAKPGLIQEIAGPLEICTENALHATLQPQKWSGEKIWIVAMYPPFVGDEEKIGSLKREILCEAGFTL